MAQGEDDAASRPDQPNSKRLRDRRHRSWQEKLVQWAVSGDLTVTRQANWGMSDKMVPEILYRRSAVQITIVLLVLMLLGAQLGYMFGRIEYPLYDELARTQFISIQAAMLGLFSLLVGFTFSMALSRFEYRKQMVVQESNAIGTTILRSQFLPERLDAEVKELFRRYVEIRLESVLHTLQGSMERHKLDREDGQIHNRLWRIANEAAESDPRSVPLGLFTHALNDLIDSQTRRDIAIANHVPENVVLFMLGFAVLTVVILGYGNGLAGVALNSLTSVYCLIVAFVMGLIIDLDRPQTGLSRISQQSMLKLYETLDTKRR